MGLDTVELVMMIEEEFGVELPDAEAEKITTVGELRDFIVLALKSEAAGKDPSGPEAVLTRIQRILEKEFGIPPEQAVPSAHIIDDLKLD